MEDTPSKIPFLTTDYQTDLKGNLLDRLNVN